MPVLNAKEKFRKGKIRVEDIPYIATWGNWDNTDVKNAKNKKSGLKSDTNYGAGGYEKEQSVSILGCSCQSRRLIITTKRLNGQSVFILALFTVLFYSIELYDSSSNIWIIRSLRVRVLM